MNVLDVLQHNNRFKRLTHWYGRVVDYQSRRAWYVDSSLLLLDCC